MRLCIHLCMCLFTYVCTCIHIYTHVRVCECVRRDICLYVCVNIHICVRLYVHILICVCVYVFIYTFGYVYVFMYVFIYVCSYMHTCVCMCMCVQRDIQIGSVAFPPGQWTSSQLQPCHRLFETRWARPCSLWLLLIPWAQRLSLWDNWGDERGCDEGHWHAHTRGLPWSLPGVFGTEQQVHCSRRRLLRRGLEFHVCTINKSAHTKKVWKLI